MQKDVPRNNSNDLLDEIAEQFELAWNQEIRISDFLSTVDDSSRTAVAAELIRLDMEYRWKAGKKAVVEDYLRDHPNCHFSISEIGEIAFEEYRLRNQFDFPVNREAFSERLGIDVSSWPVWDGKQVERKSDTMTLSATIVQPAVGDEFHGYELVGVLGEGAFGRVYLARQADLANRFVALKVTTISDNEPQALARLQHTNIVPIYSLKREGGLQSICMPFLGLVTIQDLFFKARDPTSLEESGRELISTIAGQKADTVRASSKRNFEYESEFRNLFDLSQQSTMPAIAGLNYQQTLIWMFGKIAEGLAFAHSRNIVHGDMKPGNVLVSDDGQPLILDFHLAANENNSAKPGYAGGTLPYMSPRHLQTLISDATPDPSCDVFAIGAMMFEALTGQLPYPSKGSDDQAIRQMIDERRKPPPRVRSLNRKTPVDIETIVDRCLSADPLKRYGSIEEVRIDLDRQLSNWPLRFSPNRSIRERLGKWTRRHPRSTSATAMALLATLIIAVAGILARSHFARATTIQSVEKSRNFVDKLDRLVVPLTIPGVDSQTLAEYRDNVIRSLAERTGESSTPVAEYIRNIEMLPDDIRLKEQDSVLNAQYWLSASQFLLASNQTDSQKRKSAMQGVIDQIESARAIKSDLPAAFLQLEARACELIGNKEQSLEILKSISMPDSNQDVKPEGSLLVAESFRRMGDEQGAIVEWAKILARNPGNYIGWLLKGNSHFRLGEMDRAIECFSMSIGLDENKLWGWFQRGYTSLEKRDFANALSDFSRCIELQPDDPDGYLHRAQALKGLGKNEEAIKDLSMAIELGTTQTRAWYVRYQLRRMIGDDDSAKKDLETFSKLEPIDATGWISRGMAQVALSNPKQALSDFEMALTIDPESTIAIQNIATIQSEFLGKLPEAIEAMDLLVAIAPGDMVALVTRGVLLARNGDREKAHADAVGALNIREDADLLFRSAGVFALTSSKENESDAFQAISLLRRAASIDPRLVLSRATEDDDLDKLRNMDEFQELIKQINSLVRQ